MKLSEKQLQELKDTKILISDLDDRYFIESRRFVEMNNILKLLNENICSFEDIVDKYKSVKNKDNNNPCLDRLLINEELFKELIENNKLTIEDLKYLLNRIDEWYELFPLNSNTSLIKKILNEFLLDKKTVDKFNAMIEYDYWYKDRDIQDIFEAIDFHATHYCNFGHWHKVDEEKIDKEILELNEMNKYTYIVEFNKEQKLELYEILKNNASSRNILKQIVDSNLHDTYDFETLKKLLNKDDNKKKTKFNL